MSVAHEHGYWWQWVQPPTVITLLVAGATVYASQVVQSERLDVMRVRLAAIERDYQRRDVLAERLSSIDGRLYAIEIKLEERARERERERDRAPVLSR